MVSDLYVPTIEVPRGHVTVELFDADSGRCVQREEGDNFVSIFAIETLKTWQRFCWSQYAAGTQPLDAFGRSATDVPPFPFNHLGCWNDATAESSGTERDVRGGVLIAAASRFPQGSPIGARGVVNIGESDATTGIFKFVADWLTTTGNGTFQSVGWLNATGVSGSSVFPVGIFPDPYYGAAPLGVNIATATTFYKGGLWHDGTDWVTLHTAGQTAGTSGYAIYTVNPTTGVGTLVFNIPTGDFRYQTNTSNSPPNANDVCKIGSDFYVIGAVSGSGTQVAKYNSAGVQQWLVFHNGGASEMPSGATFVGLAITTDGTDLYVSGSNGGQVYRLSAATGLVLSGPVNVPTAFSGVSVTGIAWDGTNLRCINSAGQLFTMTTAGALVTTDPIVSLGSAGDSGTATAPFSGTWTAPSAAINNAHAMTFNNPGGSSAMDDMARVGNLGLPNMQYPGSASGVLLAGGGLHFRAGKVWTTSGPTGPSTTPTRICELTYTALGSRVRLASPVVKDSSKTMKITYTLTFA